MLNKSLFTVIWVFGMIAGLVAGFGMGVYVGMVLAGGIL